jgi:hypothetical protein
MRAIHINDYGRGIMNSTTVVDVLADPGICQQDIPNFIKLNINTIFIDGVDVTQDHSICMSQLEDAGIYVLVNLNGLSKRSFLLNGILSSYWDYHKYEHVEAVIDEYQKYSNTLGFVYAMARMDGGRLPQMKALIIHMKEYIKQKNYRRIPVGYEGGKSEDDRDGTVASSLADYLNCGNQDSSPDFLSLYPSPHCPTKADIMHSRLIERFSNYSIPTVLSYGCDVKSQHNYTELQDIYGSKSFAGASFRQWFDNVRNGWGGGKAHNIKLC